MKGFLGFRVLGFWSLGFRISGDARRKLAFLLASELVVLLLEFGNFLPERCAVLQILSNCAVLQVLLN